MKKRETIYLPVEVAEALHRASLAAGGYGEKTRIATEAISAHPEVQAQMRGAGADDADKQDESL